MEKTIKGQKRTGIPHMSLEDDDSYGTDARAS